MDTTEFHVDLDDEGQGALIITDASVLVRPAQSGQLHRVQHDTAHAYGILDLGDYGGTSWHIISQQGVEETHHLLDRAFYAYVDGYCMGKWWVDARVEYLDEDGRTQRVEEYGFEDGQDTLNFTIHCLRSEDEVDDLVRELTQQAFDESSDKVVVVRPDSSDLGYVATGLVANQPA